MELSKKEKNCLKIYEYIKRINWGINLKDNIFTIHLPDHIYYGHDYWNTVVNNKKFAERNGKTIFLNLNTKEAKWKASYMLTDGRRASESSGVIAWGRALDHLYEYLVQKIKSNKYSLISSEERSRIENKYMDMAVVEINAIQEKNLKELEKLQIIQ